MIIEKELTDSKSLIKEINMYAYIKKEVLYLENEYSSIQLHDAIDNGETVDAPRIFILIDSLNDNSPLKKWR